MTLQIKITSPEKIPSIVDIIHDQWFDKDNITLNAEKSVLEIKFEYEAIEQETRGKFWFIKKVPIIEKILRINHVENYQVIDSAKVGKYDFNNLEYDYSKQEISITTGVPIDIKIRIRQFEISVEDTNKIIMVKKRFFLW